MVKLTLSIVFSLLLLCVQNWLVMKWHSYDTLVYSTPSAMLMIMVINFFLAFSILHSIESTIPDVFKSNSQEEQF